MTDGTPLINLPLATPAQLGAYLGRTFADNDPSALLHLFGASELFRFLANQTVSVVTGDEVELGGSWSHVLWLPERPVLDVYDVSVETVNGTFAIPDESLRITRRGQLTSSWQGDWTFTPGLGISGSAFGFAGISGDTGVDWRGPDSTVHLTYDHGYADIPAEVTRVVLAMASRSILNPVGLASRQIGTYQEAFDPQGMSEWERSVIEGYSPVDRVP